MYIPAISSTISSGLNALAAVVLQDMVRPFCLPEMNESTAANVSKGLGRRTAVITSNRQWAIFAA